MVHEWKAAIEAMLHRPTSLKYLTCFVSGDTAELDHGLPVGTAVVIVVDYLDDDWFDPYVYYIPGTCCRTCDAISAQPRLINDMPMLGVVREEEWMRTAGFSGPMNVVAISENDLAGLSSSGPETDPGSVFFDIGDRVQLVSPDGTLDTTDTGTITGEFENGDEEVIWDSTPHRASAHPTHTLRLVA